MELGYIIFGLFVLLFIILIAYMIKDVPKTWNILSQDFWTAHFIANPMGIYSRSTGYYDHPAMMALERARHVHTAGAHALAGAIIMNNIIEPQITQPADQLQHFQTAELQALYDEAIEHFTIALIENPTVDNTPIRGEHPTTHITPYIAQYRGQNDFDVYPQLIIANVVHNIITLELIRGMQLGAEMNFGNLNVLREIVEQRQTELITERRDAARVATKGKAAATIDYVKRTEVHRSDEQNVHDPGVLAHAKGIVDRIKADFAASETATISPKFAIRDELMENADKYSSGRTLIFEEVMIVFNRLSPDNKIIKLGISDEECLSLIWSRANIPENAANRDNIKQAVFDALYDCWETVYTGREIVCATGRTLRLISALTTLDHDNRNWEMTVMDEHKNEIMELVGVRIIDVAKREKTNADPDIKRAAYYYLAETKEQLDAVGDVSEEAEEKLFNIMKQEVEDVITKYIEGLEQKGISKMSDYYIDLIKKDAVAAIM